MPNPFTTDGSGRAANNPLTLTVAEVLAATTSRAGDEQELTVRVAADGYLIAYAAGAGNQKPAVTAWTGEGSGARHGHPERWRQNYYREFASDKAAKDRFDDLIAKHGGPADGVDQ